MRALTRPFRCVFVAVRAELAASRRLLVACLVLAAVGWGMLGWGLADRSEWRLVVSCVASLSAEALVVVAVARRRRLARLEVRARRYL